MTREQKLQIFWCFILILNFISVSFFYSTVEIQNTEVIALSLIHFYSKLLFIFRLLFFSLLVQLQKHLQKRMLSQRECRKVSLSRC